MIKRIEEMFSLKEQSEDLDILKLLEYTGFCNEKGIAMSSGCAGCASGGGCTASAKVYEKRNYGPKYEEA